MKRSISAYKTILRGLEEEKALSVICREANISHMTLWRWAERTPKLKTKIRNYRQMALENALQLCALGGFRTGLTKKYNKAGDLIEEKEYIAPPNVAALIFSLVNLDSENWKNNRDKFYSSKSDQQLAESEYEILSEKDNKEAKELLKEFEG